MFHPIFCEKPESAPLIRFGFRSELRLPVRGAIRTDAIRAETTRVCQSRRMLTRLTSSAGTGMFSTMLRRASLTNFFVTL